MFVAAAFHVPATSTFIKGICQWPIRGDRFHAWR
jgi:hypothetical protein